jgi:hypothetical protein
MDGTKFGEELLLNQHVPCQQISSKACLINKEKIIICWEAACQDGSDKAVMGKFLPTSPFLHNLQPFQITAPSHDSSCDSTNVTIFWERPTIQPVVYPCELLFTLYYSLDSTFHECGKIETRKTIATLQELQKGKLYYAKVVAQNILQSSVWSTNTVAFFVNHAAVGESNPSYYNYEDDCNCDWNTNSDWTFVFDEYNDDIEEEENEKTDDDKDDERDNVERPSSFLLKNAPNPFNSTTMIYYAIPHDGAIEIAVYSTRGRKVRSLLKMSKSDGQYHTVWDGYFDDGRVAPSGIYFYKMSFVSAAGAKQNIVKKMSLVR